MPLSAQRQKLKKNRNHLQRRKTSGQAETIHTQPVLETAEPQLDLQNFSAENVMQMQRTIGNTATRKLVQQNQQSVVHRKPSILVQREGDEPGQPGEQSVFNKLLQQMKDLPGQIALATAKFLTHSQIQSKAVNVDNPQFSKKYQGRFILARKKFYMMEGSGSWSDEIYSYNDDSIHKLNVVLETEKFYIGTLADGETAAVKKENTTGAEYEKLSAETPLFEEGQPKAEDVKQGSIGDCYLMAAVSSLAQQNPEYIKRIMVDQGERVAVRLYDVDQTDPSNHKFTAKFISVEKSIAKLQGNTLYNKGALWVSMLEKAYAAGGFTGSGAAPTAPTPSFESIAGGFSRHAFEVLTGEPAKSEALAGGPLQQTSGDFANEQQVGWQGNMRWFNMQKATVPWDASTVKAYDDLKAGPQPDDYTPLPIFQSVFKGNKGHLDAWITYVKTNAVKDMFTKQNTDLAAGYAHQLTIQDFQALFNKEGGGVDVSVGNAVLEWIKTNQMYPGELGTAVYSKSQLKAYTDIKDALSAGKSVALNTHKFPSKTTDGTGHSGGEAISKGMVGGHAYSALGVKANTTNDPNTEPGTGKFYWIQVRNPWGKYGREYDFSQVLPADAGKAVENGDGMFWLELSELTKFFSSVDYSG